MKTEDVISKIETMEELLNSIKDNLGSDNQTAIENFAGVEEIFWELTDYFDGLEGT